MIEKKVLRKESNITFAEMECISRENSSTITRGSEQMCSEKYGTLDSEDDIWKTWHNPGDSVRQESTPEMPWKHILQRVKKSKLTSGCSLE